MKIIIIAIGILITAVVLLFLQRRAVSMKKSVDYSDIEKILSEVEVYEAYGKKQQARQLLQKCLEANPGNREIQKKLESYN